MTRRTFRRFVPGRWRQRPARPAPRQPATTPAEYARVVRLVGEASASLRRRMERPEERADALAFLARSGWTPEPGR